MKVHFFGAANGVTGSCSLVETGGKKILIDCGMFQGGNFNEEKNHEIMPFSAKDLSAVLVTHAHLDHTGRLPVLVKEGFTGFFYATPATIELTELILNDALTVMRHDNAKFGSPILYEESDIAGVMEQFKAIDYYKTLDLFHDKKVKIYFRDAGHIFGSAFIEIQAEKKKVVFSGDVGNVNVPILRNTDDLPEDVDLLVCEATYGDRIHESDEERHIIVEKAVVEAMKKGGVMMIPSFSLERTQELLYSLNDLIDLKKTLPRVPIYLDSPLAIGATKVYRKYTDYYNKDAKKLIKEGDDIFNFPGLTLTGTRDDSMKINHVPNPKVVIAGAGMMNGGRILHHALRYLSDSKSTLMIIGYQAAGTLGRQILEGQPSVVVMGEKVSVKCAVKAVGAFSAHGDQNKLLAWISSGKNLPKQVCLNHGETEPKQIFADKLKQELKINAQPVDEGFMVEV